MLFIRRDLFRWGERYRLSSGTESKWEQHLAEEGYLVLSGKVRKPEEAEEIQKAIFTHFKVKIVPENLFSLHESTSEMTRGILERLLNPENQLFRHLVWTYQTRKMAVLVMKALEFKEPVLLVGQTGGGKTTVCQLVAALNQQTLYSVNCHMHTESSDFLGNLRPVRSSTEKKGKKLFEWVNGPLIDAMKKGGLFLADEISLADDSVLERLNSLLEPERSLLLTESETNEVVVANEQFVFVGTMNPGGDYGKKELSPALRNRFTEIWCGDTGERRDDLRRIAEHNLKETTLAGKMMEFLDWMTKSEIGTSFVVSIRDVLNWVNFVNAMRGGVDG